MRDELVSNNGGDECFILNLDESSNSGTHWTCLYKKDKACYYFDSYGFSPPKEIYQYCCEFTDRYYNTFRIQTPDQVICGHYCIYVLYKLRNVLKFYDILDELYRYSNT